MTNLNIRLDTSVKLKKGDHPVVLQATWINNVRRKRIKGFTCKRTSWDFDEHCYKHSERKNELLSEFEKKARRILDYMEEWDYKRFVKELGRSAKKESVQQRKLIEYCFELQQGYIKSNQVGYSDNFKTLGAFLKRCFAQDMRIADFGERELNVILRKMDELEMKGHSYLKYLQIVLSYSIKNGYSKAEDCPIKTKYSPTGYDINKRKGKQSKHIKKNRIKDLTEPEKQRVIEFYHTADIPATQKIISLTGCWLINCLVSTLRI